MPEYRRSLVKGGTYFFTVVTCNRRPILTSEISRAILHDAWKQVSQSLPFTTDAICLLPDHIHCIWTLPDTDHNYSLRWGEIKKIFSRKYHQTTGDIENRNESHINRREAAIWQRRFWEHTIRDEVDLKNHLDYIHFNPVKHGLVQDPSDWQWSSYQRYVQMGFYESGKPTGWNIDEKSNFGE